MKINNTDLPSKIELKDRTIYTSTINSITGWYVEALDGVLLNQLKDFRTIQLKFFINTDSEDEAYKETSKLIENLSTSSIIFDDIDLIFECYVQGSQPPQRVQNGKFLVTVDLKNAKAIATDETTVSFDITAISAKRITVNYYVNWEPTVSYYTDAFDANDLHQLIATEQQYISTTAPTATSYDSYFAQLGIDLNKYKPTIGTDNGTINLDSYSADTAANLTSIDIYYNKIKLNGYPDIPGGFDYPNVVWRSGESETHYFSLPLTTEQSASNLSVEVWGRYYDISTNSNASSTMFMTNNLGMGTAATNLTYGTITVNPNSAAVFPYDTTKGQRFVIVTLETLAGTPMRKNGIYYTDQGDSTVVFNGSTLDKTNKNLTGGTELQIGIEQYFDLCRIRVWQGTKEEGTLIYDLIPINSSVKNCFVNNFDDALYDVVTMTYYPWKSDSSTSAEPTTPMAKPGTGDDPQPVVLPTSSPYLFMYADGTGINQDFAVNFDFSGPSALINGTSTDSINYNTTDYEPTVGDTVRIVWPVPTTTDKIYYGFTQWPTTTASNCFEYGGRYRSAEVNGSGLYMFSQAVTLKHAGYFQVEGYSDSEGTTKVASLYFHVKSAS